MQKRYIYQRSSFFSEKFCSQLISDESIDYKVAPVYNQNDESNLKNGYRDSYIADLLENYSEKIHDQLVDLKDELEEFFSLELESIYDFQLLKYDKGHFFKKHRDNGGTKRTKDRKLTILIYLNDSVSQLIEVRNQFTGGELKVYGLVPGSPDSAFSIVPKAGKLVVFRSELLHEVSPIVEGSRFCLVAWAT